MIPITFFLFVYIAHSASSESSSVPGTHLDLQSKNLKPHNVSSLIQILNGSEIISLNLEHNRLREAGAKSLAKILKYTKLTSLNLAGNGIGTKGALAIAEVLNETRITELNLAGNRIVADGSLAVVRLLEHSRVTNLNLAENSIWRTVEILKILNRTRIVRLSLESNGIGLEGALAISEILKFTELNSLNLANNFLHDRGAMEIVKVLNKTRITSLDFGRNGLGGEEFDAIVESLRFSGLVFLGLEGNSLRVDHARTIARILNETRLNHLNLGNNYLMDQGVEAIFKALPESKITSLDLENNRIWSGVEIDRLLNRTELRYLNLKENPGIGSIATGLNNTQINHLDLEFCGLGVAGAEALAGVLSGTGITDLRIGQNGIGDQGVRVLGKILKDTTIRSLNLYMSGITDEGAGTLARVLEDTLVTEVELKANDIGPTVLDEIATKLQSNKLKINKVCKMFDNFVRFETGSLKFVVSDFYGTEFYVKFVNEVSKNPLGYINILSGKYRKDRVKDFIVNVRTRLEEFLVLLDRLKLSQTYEEFENFVTIRENKLEFVDDNGLRYFNFSKILSNDKIDYVNYFTYRGNYTRVQIQDFIFNIEERLLKRGNSHRICQEFPYLVESRNGSLRFVKGRNKSMIIEFVYLIGKDREEHVKHLIDEMHVEHSAEQINDFIFNVEIKLEEFFRDVDSTIENIGHKLTFRLSLYLIIYLNFLFVSL